MTQHGHLQVLELMTNRLREIDERILSLTGEVILFTHTFYNALSRSRPRARVLSGW